MQQSVYINYINGVRLPAVGKAKFILDHIEEAQAIPEPIFWEDNIVVVVENTGFDAARYVDDKRFLEIAKQDDGRDKTWLLVPNAKVYCNEQML